MKQSESIIRQLKKLIKLRGMNYARLATALNLSEASVKRIFSKGTFTLERLDQICRVLDVDFYELAKLSRTTTGSEQKHFTERQETALAQDEKLFVFFHMLLTGVKLPALIKKFQFQNQEATSLLLKLDRLGLIEYHSDRRIRFLVSRNLQWLKGGPLNLKYEEMIKSEFLQSQFSSPFENLKFVYGYYSEADLRLLNREIEKLILRFKETSEVCVDQKDCKGLWLLVAYRPWVFSVLDRYKRPNRF